MVLLPLPNLLNYFHIKTSILSIFYTFLSHMLRDTVLSGNTYFSTGIESVSQNKCVWLAKISFMENSQAPFCYSFLWEDNVLHAVFKAECSGGLDKTNGSPSFLCETLWRLCEAGFWKKAGNKTSSQKRSQWMAAVKRWVSKERERKFCFDSLRSSRSHFSLLLF